MKFTKLIAASFAVLTMFSCSKERIEVGREIQPGDAVLSLKVGGKTTTYASKGDETAIKALRVFAAYTDNTGAKTLIEIQSGVTAAGVDYTFADGTYKPNTKATLYFVANAGTAFAVPGDVNTIEALEESTSIYSIVSDTLQIASTGLVATRKFEVDMNPGLISDASGTAEGVATGNVTLKRLAARVYAESSTAGSIAGYTVSFSGNNTAAGYFNYTGSTVAAGSSAPYTIKGTAVGQYNSKEAVGYVYPGGTVTISVSNGGITVPVTFSPISNKNYKLMITPANGANPKFTVEIVEWENDGEELGVDFTKTTKTVDAGVVNAISGLSLVAGAENVIEAVSGGVGTATDYIEIVDLFGSAVTLTGFKLVGQPATYATIDPNYGDVSTNKRLKMDLESGKVLISMMPNNTGASLTYRVKYYLEDSKNVADSAIVAFTQPSIAYPANFSVKIGNYEWMSINTQNTGDLADDAAIVNEINALSGATFFDKLVAFAKTSDANISKLAGNFSRYTNGGTTGAAATNNPPTCPIGYAVPSAQILRNDFFGLDGTWPAITTETVFAATEVPVGSIFTGLTISGNNKVTNTLSYTKSANSSNGYLAITDPNGNRAIAAWKGQMNASGAIVSPHISGYISSTINTTNTERMIIGVITNSYGDLVHTQVANTSTSSSLVRCVKQTPEMYWNN